MAGLDLTRLAADLRRRNSGPTNDMPVFEGLAALVRFDVVEAIAAAIEAQANEHDEEDQR